MAIFFSGPKVTETEDTIIVTGINSEDLGKFITRVWKTSTIEKYMFKSITKGRFGVLSGKIEFYKFFVIEMIYILEQLAKARSPRIPSKTCHAIADALRQNTWVNDTLNANTPPKLDLSRLKDFNYKPKEFQQRFLNYYNETPSRYHLNGALLNGAAGSGKGVTLDTRVRIPNGWKRIGDLKLGDVVSTPNGDCAKVTGIFDNKNMECYRVTFTDGRSCVCDIEHLWEIFSLNHGGKYKTMSMKELLTSYNRIRDAKLKQGIREDKIHYRLYIPLIDPGHSCDLPANLPIDPYVLGVILGDGNISHTGGVVISKQDVWIKDEVKRLIAANNCEVSIISSATRRLTYNIKSLLGDKSHSFSKSIIDLGLNGKRSWEKFIPEMYMNGSFEQRLALIQGLMDTDGCVNKPTVGKNGIDRGKQGTIEWFTTSEVLARQMRELCLSVGCIVKLQPHQTYYTHNGQRKPGRLSWRIYIRSQIPSMLFRTPVKKNLTCDHSQYLLKGLKLRIKSIQQVDNQDTRCITVDHPDKLYIIDDYIVTHNTATTMFTQYCAEMQRIIIVCPKNALDRVWTDDVNRMFKQPPKQWTSNMKTSPTADTQLFVYHYEALPLALEHHKDDFSKYTYGLVLDESHNMNEIKSQRTQLWLELCKRSGSKNIIHASGTPFKAMGSESIPLLRAIDPLFTPPVEEAYKKIFGDSAQRGLDILKNRLGLVSFIITKDELGLEKPIMNLVPVQIPEGNKYTLTAVREVMAKFIEERVKYYRAREDQDKEYYQRCLEIHEEAIGLNLRKAKEFKYYLDCVKEIQRTTDYAYVKTEISFCKQYEFKEISASLPKDMVKPFRNVCSIIKYLPLKIQGECLGQVVGRMRIEAHKAMCKNVPFRDICQATKKKTVVFTSYVDVLEEAQQICQQHQMNPIVVYGKTNSNLNNMIKSFEKDTNVNPLIATYDSLSTAVPLTMADNMIMLNAPFRAYIQEQAISRIHRLNQDSQTVVWQCYLDTGKEPNISSRSLDIMQWSQKQVEQITGVKSPYLLEDSEGGDVKVSTESLFDDLLIEVVSKEENQPHLPITQSHRQW